MKRTFALAIIAGTLLTGCNTVSGFGRDLSTLGDALTEASADASDGKPSENDNGELCGAAYSRGKC